jgi:hypothetical protein
VPRHVARLVTRIVARLIVDYFAYAARLGASARRAAHRLSLTTLPTPRYQLPRLLTRLVAWLVASRVRLPRHVARPITRLIVDYSVRCDFVLQSRWLYFSHVVHGDYLSHGNTGSTSSTPRAATTSSSGRIELTIHLD